MNWEIITAGVFVVVGLIEYLKGCLPTTKPNTWRIALVPASFGAALVGLLGFGLPIWPRVLLTGLLILAASQLGYSVVVEAVKKRLGGGV